VEKTLWNLESKPITGEIISRKSKLFQVMKTSNQDKPLERGEVGEKKLERRINNDSWVVHENEFLNRALPFVCLPPSKVNYIT
jgi:hypothetical protein